MIIHFIHHLGVVYDALRRKKKMRKNGPPYYLLPKARILPPPTLSSTGNPPIFPSPTSGKALWARKSAGLPELGGYYCPDRQHYKLTSQCCVHPGPEPYFNFPTNCLFTCYLVCLVDVSQVFNVTEAFLFCESNIEHLVIHLFDYIFHGLRAQFHMLHTIFDDRRRIP